jgi:hypothetical protein
MEAELGSERLVELLSRENRKGPLLIALLGPAGAGKSSYLLQSIQEAKKHKWKCIFVDFQAARGIYDEDQFYGWLVNTIRQQWSGTWKTKTPRLDFTKLLKSALSKSKSNVILCLDSLEQLCDPCARSLIGTLREIQTFASSQAAWNKFRCVVAGSVSIYALRRQFGSPNLQFTLLVLPDTSWDLKKSTREYLRVNGKSASDTAVDLLCQLTRGEEYFLKLLIDRMPLEISETDVDDATRLVLKDAGQIRCMWRPVQLYQVDEEFRNVVNNLLEGRIVVIPDSMEDISRYQLLGAVCIDPKRPQTPEFRNGLVQRLLLETARTPQNNPSLTLLKELQSEVIRANSIDDLLRVLRRAWECITGNDSGVYLSCRELGLRNYFEVSETGIRSGTSASIVQEDRIAMSPQNGIETQLIRKGSQISVASSWRGSGLDVSIVSLPTDDLFASISTKILFEFWMSFLGPLCEHIQDHVLRALGRYLLTIPHSVPKKIFVSSTFLDLDDHRAHIMQEIQRRDLFFRGMEHFGAASSKPAEFLKEQVRKSDVYLGIFALRYGSEDAASGKSMTELEYDEAVRLGKPRLCYVASDDSNVLKGHVERDPEKFKKLQAFLARVKGDVVYEFKDIRDLAHQVYIDLGDPEKVSL